MKKKTLIIGGVAGGATTATRLRRRDEEMEIIMFERGKYISYANCGLPYYIGDTIKSRDALLLQTPEAMESKYNVDVRTLNEVIEIVPDQKKVIVKNLKTDEIYEESYDNLVIATGSSPIKPNISGIDGKNIFTLWNVHDMDVIKAHIKENKPKSAAVIGGGFIGLEMAENLHKSAGFVPGVRPGEATEKYFERVLTKVSLIGGLFAALLAVTPILISNYTALSGIQFGGTSLLILIGVGLDFSRQLDSQLVMRHYQGFLK